jgi:molecular chaperone GrpE
MADEQETNGIDEAIAAEAAGIESVDARLKDLETELSSAKDRHLRLAAEFDNYRKRVARDQADSLARAQTALIARLVDVLDDLDRVAHHSESSNKEALLEGVDLVERKFRQVLESAGLELIDATGGPFDPSTMEAITTVPTESPDEDDHVSDVFQPGYRFQGMLLRPARVVVKKYGEH